MFRKQVAQNKQCSPGADPKSFGGGNVMLSLVEC